MSGPRDVLIVTRRDIARLMTPADYLRAAERAFAAAAAGRAAAPQPMHLPVERGGFHAKGASITLDRPYVAVKLNGNFPANRADFGLPTIQGAILLADAADGTLLAILDSIEVTLRRTAAASALAARHLARPESATLLVCGCGEQGRAHVAALRQVLPLRRCLLWDRDAAAAQALASELAGSAEVEAVAELAAASPAADVIATCTTAREPFLDQGMVRPGTFIAAVGADSPDKSEIAPGLMGQATVVVDSARQCAAMGDLRHALEAGTMTEADVHAELGQILVGERSGRRSAEEIVIFDSTGTGVQDVAVAATVYERCADGGNVRAIALADG